MASYPPPSSTTRADAGETETLRRTEPVKEIPGICGSPFIDRLQYFYFKGEESFFQSKIDLYGSTVFRTNMPPGPFMASDSRVIAVLDAKSFPVLFNTSVIEKKDVLTGTYMPTTKLTGGRRVCAYLDPSEPTHAKVKELFFTLLASRKEAIIPSFRSAFAARLFAAVDSKLASAGRADFNALNDEVCFDFLGEAFFGAPPSKFGAAGLPAKAGIWLSLQLAPLACNVSKYLPWFVEDPLLHTFPLPSFVAKPAYKALYAYFESAGAAVLEGAKKVGLSREEACHNLLFMGCFNAHGGFKIFFPALMKYLAVSGNGLHDRLTAEVRTAVSADGDNGLVTVAALEKMELVKSVVYEVLRLEPPVKYQYGHARKDFVIESHDAAFQVRKGEMIFGYQPFATRDKRVFGANADKFVPDRFIGEHGAKLLSNVWWSNGPETENPTVSNKQCPGKNFVVLIARLLVAELFLYYDTFTADVSKSALGAQVIITSVSKAKNKLA
ncbi:Allene oxide synthase 2 [Platanthera zijinensis]|uniref:Allene oxide synthase 2 n=1 Tax=Platanthera zijinensis TaxID=2320716 RepID=A0AAP0GB23_9ASPA